MATENINIVIREDGSRQVTQNIQQLAAGGDKAASSMDTLARALEVLAAALAIDKLKDYADEWASVTGIVEVATKSHAEATAVLNQLFDAAQRIRSPIDELAQLYSRVARAAGDLGSSQAQAIQFTEEVGQALVVQHTTATQAAGALLQLGQLLGTGKIRAQEFNSVNENLAVVLQVVARNITAAGGSVNTLKTLVEAGKVTSKDFFEAFLKGSKGLQEDFNKSAFTIGQGFTLISNTLVHMVGDLNEATGASNAFGRAAQFVAGHMKEIEDAIVTVAKVLAVATAAWVTYTAAQATANAVAGVSAFLAEIDAVARGTVVILGSAEAQRQKAVATAEAALVDSRAAIAARNAAVAQAQGAVAVAEAATAEVVAKQALIDVTRASAAANLQHANTTAAVALRSVEAARAAGAQSFALATLRDATAELVAAEGARSIALQEFAAVRQVEIAQERALTAALGEQAVAQAALTEATVAGDAAMVAANNTLIASTGRVGAATALAAGTTGRLAQVFSLLRGLIAPVIGFIGELFVLINANPITALITGLVVVTGLLLGFGDSIKLGTDKVTTLGNVMAVFKDSAKSTFEELKGVAGAVWDDFTDHGKSALGQTTTAIAVGTSRWAQLFGDFFQTPYKGIANIAVLFGRTIDAIAGLLLGLVFLVERTFSSISDIISNTLKVALDKAFPNFISFANKVIDATNTLGKKAGLDLIPHIETPTTVAESFRQAGTYVAASFEDGFAAQGGTVEKTIVGIFDKAAAKGRADAEEALRLLEHQDIPDLNAKTTPKKTPVDPKEFDAARNALAQLLDKIDPAQGATLELAKATDVLNRALKDGVITRVQYNRYLGEATAYYQEQADPLAKSIAQIQQQTNLLDLNVKAREVEAQVEQIVQEKREKGQKIGLAEIDQLREAITLHQQRNAVVAEEDAILGETVLAREKYVNQLAALQELLSRPLTAGKGFTEGDRAQQLLKIDPEVLSSTKVAIDAIKAQYESLYEHIQTLNEKGVVDDATATRLKVENATRLKQKVLEATLAVSEQRLALGSGSWADAQLVALSKLSSGFTTFADGAGAAMGDFFKSFTDGFADSVGKAVVESDNLNDALHNVAQQALEGLISSLVKLGIQYVVNAALMSTTATAATTTTTGVSVAAAAETASAWATAAELVNAATFGAGAVAGSAAVALAVAEGQGLSALSALPGHAAGGYTGDVGRNQIAGVVHGQEYVMNADATARNRSLLEQLNAGHDASASIRSAAARGRSNGTGDLRVVIEDHGTPKTYEQAPGITPGEVRLIARDEAQKTVPSALKAEFSNPNSTGSKALRQNTTTRPRRN